MVHVDLEQFASTGVLGPFDHRSSRDQIVNLLGLPDQNRNPKFLTYGNLAFELKDGVFPPCRIQIAFPHSSHSKTIDSKWKLWHAINLDNWPDQRLKWEFGHFHAGFGIDEIVTHADFLESDMDFDDVRIFYNRRSGVDLFFEFDEYRKSLTLSEMIAHPAKNAG